MSQVFPEEITQFTGELKAHPLVRTLLDDYLVYSIYYNSINIYLNTCWSSADNYKVQ
jgi:hypothetical protein